MPLEQGNSRQAIGDNIKTEEAAGRPRKQAIAIAMSEAGESRKQRRVGVKRKSDPAPSRTLWPDD